jgi:hypothetical protein
VVSVDFLRFHRSHREKGIALPKGKKKASLGEKVKGKDGPPEIFTWIPLHIQKPRGARTHETKRFPGYGGLPKGELTPPNIRHIYIYRDIDIMIYIYIYIYTHMYQCPPQPINPQIAAEAGGAYLP